MTSNHTLARYPSESLQELMADIQAMHRLQAPLASLASDLMHLGIQIDLNKAKNLGVSPRYVGVSRDFANARFYEHETIKGAPWADDPTNPLGGVERWNEGRRATLTDIQYYLDDDGLPINPYQSTGLRGRGCLGQFGPNHAVDNGIVLIKPDALSGEFTLHALGILRKYDNNAPAFAGGFAKFTRNENGTYDFDLKTQVTSQAEELFEEAISGSVPLLPEYEDQAKVLHRHEVAEREAAGQVITDFHWMELLTEAKTAIKLKQVQELDPGFWERFCATVADSYEAYAGPVLNDNRTTDNAWIETRLAWFTLDDDTWGFIRGDNPRFDYKFEAGDDASGVVAHKIDADLIRDAYASHGPMFLFMAASYLARSAIDGKEVPASIVRQLDSLLNTTDLTAAPSPNRG